MSDNKIAALADIATELLLAELKRRSEAQNMTVEQLLAASGAGWEKAEKDADDLAKLGHETDEKL